MLYEYSAIKIMLIWNFLFKDEDVVYNFNI